MTGYSVRPELTEFSTSLAAAGPATIMVVMPGMIDLLEGRPARRRSDDVVDDCCWCLMTKTVRLAPEDVTGRNHSHDQLVQNRKKRIKDKKISISRSSSSSNTSAAVRSSILDN